MFAPVYTHVPAEIFHSRDFSLLTALLSLKEGVSLFVPVPDSNAGAMIVLPWVTIIQATQWAPSLPRRH